jgi:hypothetical protein
MERKIEWERRRRRGEGREEGRKSVRKRRRKRRKVKGPIDTKDMSIIKWPLSINYDLIK